MSSSEVETLRRELSMKKSELELADLQLAGLKKEMSDLKSMVCVIIYLPFKTDYKCFHNLEILAIG